MTESTEESIHTFSERIGKQYTRLQEQLDEYGDDDIVEKESFGETLADVEIEEYYKLSHEDAKDLLSFYITTSAMVEQESALIINAYAFNFGMNQRGSLKFLQEELTQSTREDMLYYLGIIDSGLKGELARVRQRRNELAHSRRHDEVEDVSRVQNNLKRAKEATAKLKSIGLDVEMGELGD